jgi:hypothetical protein
MAEENDNVVGNEDEDVARNTDKDGNYDQEDGSEAEAYFFSSFVDYALDLLALNVPGL